jgi:two-component system CheB/CheR fusion protein
MSRTVEVAPSEISLNNYIVGIGASAGGLEAINELFDNMPSNTGFSFIIIQHLSPDYKSLMGELLAKHTEMQVFEAEENMVPKANCIYLIPSRKIITLKNGRLKLEDKIRDQQPNSAIDIFFESLALDKAEKSIGIILSGTGTDGTKGIKAIKNNGGSVIVQDPITAQFDGMPNSAVSSGYVDLILSPDMVGEELLDFVNEAPLLRSFNALSLHEETILNNILELIFKTTNHDFSNYKRPTINRRLAKRMAERNINSLSEYYNYLSNRPEEIKKLCKEFLLNVTRFFRDEEAFEILRVSIIPRILEQKQNGEAIKVWTVACSTGEEAYSLAMLFDEAIHESRRYEIEVKIFASDINQEVIDSASKGFYTDEQVKNISPQRLSRYFTKEADGYKVVPTLRKMIVFARHDISRDPPFSRIDLLTCRNMLIYMNPLLQKSILLQFHFAISEEGFMFLGASENISVLKDVMAEIDKKWKIYQCVSKAKVGDPESYSNPVQKFLYPNSYVASKAKNALNNMAEIFKETLLEEYDYAGLFIDQDFEVKQAVGNFKKFMDFPEGNFNFNLLKLVPADLSIALSTGIRKAIKNNERVVQKSVKVKEGTLQRCITIIIKPYLIQRAYLQPFLFIVLKEEEFTKREIISIPFSTDGVVDKRIMDLEQELSDTKENLQALIEEVESANEELQSSNEEIISSNEELQSTNEELQSLNEELHTVNAEHQLKIKELVELNDDMNNYFRNTDVGQIFIDTKMTIRKFTPVVTGQVNLISSDIGRSIADISTNIKNLNFINDIKSVMQSAQVLEKEVSTDNDKVFLMRIVPYLRQNKSFDGVVVNFFDISEIKKMNYILEAVFDSSTSGIVALEAIRNNDRKIVDFRFITANKTSTALLGLEDQVVGKTYLELYSDADPAVFERYVKILETGTTQSFEFLNNITNRWFEIIAVKMMDGLVVTFNDITDRKTDSEKIAKGYEDLKITSGRLEATNYKLEQSNLDLLQFASVASHDLKEPLRKIQAFGNLLKDKVNNKLDEREANYLDKVINSSDRMQVLIQDILTLSRLSNNQSPISNINLSDLIAQIIDDLEISIKQKAAEIHIRPLPVVVGISGQIHQLFQNLISNAIKFNDGQPIIEIGEEPVSPLLEQELSIKSDDYFAIYIKDNGIGFDQLYSDKIFGIFQRLEKNNYEGTGIGLAIVKKIVDNHKGFIKAISTPGQGSKFTILLPR